MQIKKQKALGSYRGLFVGNLIEVTMKMKKLSIYVYNSTSTV